MAFSKTLLNRSVVGNVIMENYSLSFASVTSGDFSTGCSEILAAHCENYTTEQDGLTKQNYNGTTTVNGHIAFSGFTSNDVAYLTVFGKA